MIGIDFLCLFQIIDKKGMQIRRLCLYIFQNLHTAVFYIDSISKKFLLHRRIKLIRRLRCLIKILRKLLF